MAEADSCMQPSLGCDLGGSGPPRGFVSVQTVLELLSRRRVQYIVIEVPRQDPIKLQYDVVAPMIWDASTKHDFKHAVNDTVPVVDRVLAALAPGAWGEAGESLAQLNALQSTLSQFQAEQQQLEQQKLAEVLQENLPTPVTASRQRQCKAGITTKCRC